MKLFRRVPALALALSLALSPVLALEGMDVSVYQGDMDFHAAKADGIEAVYIRASYGVDGVDENLRRNYEEAAAAGIPLGFYHFLDARFPAEAQLQARRFAQLIRGLDYQCRPALDYELTGALSPQRATDIARAFLEALETELSVRPMLYCDLSNARRLDLGDYPLWIAQWDVDAPDLRDTAWDAWTGWQYTDTGRVAGVSTDVDRDVFTDGVLIDEPQTPTFRYTILPGDTLWTLARCFGTTVETLARLNNIQNPDRIYVGELLRVPCFA